MRLHTVLMLLVLCLLPVLSRAETLPSSPPEEEAVAPNPGETGMMSPGRTDGVTDADTVLPAEEDETEEIVEEEAVADPLEPWNRLIFAFNDRFYFWFFKPVAKGYNSVLPEAVRISVRNFFYNLGMPVRFVNLFLQGKLESAGVEIARFGVNSTIGFGGLFDVARDSLQLESRKTDTGLTLGRYGIGLGPYVIWPFLGPSSLRDTVGMVGDGFLTPIDYITPWQDAMALEAYEYFNENALRVGEYENLVESAVEPYIALRNAYSQHRKSLVGK